MYVIKVDGQEIYSPALLNDPEQQLLSISLQLEIDTAGSLSFIIPPGHAAHDSIHKLKSVVTMEWDGVEIFRGRVLEEKTDAYNQKEVYCEGDLSFLLDSVVRPFTFEGTARAFIQQVIAIHNEQVEEYKRFTLGDFSALTDDAVIPLESDGYADALSAIRAVLETHEGYLFSRYENGVRYLDFVKAYEADEGQAIEFGVNLVDLDNQTAAEELCTVLLPIGAMLEDGTTVTIASVNNGKDTIENDRAISKYGRIVKTYAFDDVTDPAELLKKARVKLDGMAFVETLILQAVDMHFLDEEKGIILPGRQVLIHTTPHGIDNQRKLCTALDLDPENPEKATYTFGKPEKTQSGAAALIASQVEKHTKSVQKLYKHYTETDYTAKIQAGLLDKQGEYLSQAMLDIDGIKVELLLKAASKELDELSGEMETLETNVTVSADGLREIIQKNDKTITELKATIDGLEHWVTDADGNVAELTNTVRGLESKVETADGRVSQLTNTADGLTNTIIGQGNDFALFYTRVDEIGSMVKDTQGNVGSLITKSDSVTAKIANVDGRVSQLAVTADGLNYTLTKQGQELSALRALIDEISLTVKDTQGAMGQLIVKSDSITGKVVSADEKMSSKFEMLAGIINLETKADGTVVSVRLDAAEDSIRLKADKTYVEKLIADEISATNAKISNITSGLTVASVLSANMVNGTQGRFTYLHGDAINLGDNNLVCYTMEFAGRSGKYFGTGGGLNLAHSHAVTVNDDGTITLGEVSAEGGNFKIADTKAYKDGVSAAYGNGYNVGYDAGKDAYLPTAINRTGFSTADKTVTVRALNSHQDLLTGQVIDAVEIYNAGWNECRAAMTRINNLYTISQNAPGTLYMLVNGNYTSVGADWVQVTSYSSAYRRPAEIA